MMDARTVATRTEAEKFRAHCHEAITHARQGTWPDWAPVSISILLDQLADRAEERGEHYLATLLDGAYNELTAA